MSEDIISKLTDSFKRFPGIGPRQARRFVYYLLNQNSGVVDNLANDIAALRQGVGQCSDCSSFFLKTDDSSPLCRLCRDENRSPSSLMVLEKDLDLEIVKKVDHYKGRFFILGGLVPILEEAPERRLRVRELIARIKRDHDKLKEVIIALAANPEGDNTTEYLKRRLTKELASGTKLTVLGRGLSTGTDLEYSDLETVRHALSSRS